MNTKKILHIITGLSIGGAEGMLYKLLSQIDQTVFDMDVISLAKPGPMSQKIEGLGVRVHSLNMDSRIPNPLAIVRLAIWMRNEKPALVQTWMYHADLIGGLAAKLAGDIPVVWGIRRGSVNPVGNKKRTLWIALACAWLSSWVPRRIVCCSEMAKKNHIAFGYAENKSVVIPNGFDLKIFQPDPGARQSVRWEFGLSPDAGLIGLIARFDPQKDHSGFINAAAILHRQHPNVYFLLCGDDITWDNKVLTGWIAAAELEKVVLLAGCREDIARLTAALDIASLSSISEGFPNVIGEAMACGVPCVVTDVGDASYIVGDTGRVVPPKDPSSLAQAWNDLLVAGEDVRAAMGRAARERIMAYFNLPDIAKRYEKLYLELA